MLRATYICSPWRPIEGRYTSEETLQYALRAVAHSMKLNEIPFAPHLYFPRFLDDTKQRQRAKGIELALRLMQKFEHIAFYIDLGMSEGMQAEIQAARDLGLLITERLIHE